MEKIRLLLKKGWGEYAAKSKVLFGESKGKPLIENGTAVEVPATDKRGEYLPNKIKKKQVNGTIRLKLLKNWGEYLTGSIIDFGEGKGQPLVADGTAIEVSKDEKINKITTGKSTGTIRLKLLKRWGNYEVDDEVDFGESKGRSLIANGTAIKVSKR